MIFVHMTELNAHKPNAKDIKTLVQSWSFHFLRNKYFYAIERYTVLTQSVYFHHREEHFCDSLTTKIKMATQSERMNLNLASKYRRQETFKRLYYEQSFYCVRLWQISSSLFSVLYILTFLEQKCTTPKPDANNKDCQHCGCPLPS